uniref:Uncharacterized protein n=1 Tax=Caenorhabditis japonica TaxID=281687 RepID=A0A8R1IG43_CAEJA
MKRAATIQIFPEPTRKIFTYLCATSRTTSLTSRTQRHQGMPPVNPEVRTNTGRQDDSSMQVSSGSFPTALLECAQRRKPADHVRKHPKKRAKGQGSPTTEEPEDQVHFALGRHTDVAHEDELVLAADGPEKPLRDTPASSLATAAVAPASIETTSTASIPVSTPVNNSGHPSAVSSSSQISTHDAETAAAQRLISQWEDDYDIEVDVSDQEEENPPPPPEKEQEETYAPEFDFAVPTIIHGVQVPAKQRYHPFHGFHAMREGEELPKDVTKRLVATIVLSQIHAFRVSTVQSFEPIEKPTIIRKVQVTAKQKRRPAKSLEWSTPIEESKIPQIAPAEANPEQVVAIPVTQFAIFVQHAHRGLSAGLPSDRSQQPTGPSTRPRLSTIYTGKHIRSQEGALMVGKHNFGTSHGTSPTRETHYHQKSSTEHQFSSASQPASLPHSTNPNAAKRDAPRRKKQPGRGRKLFPELRKQSECEVRRFHSNVTLFESQEDPGIMRHAAAVQHPGKVYLDQIEKFLDTSTPTRSLQQQGQTPAQLPPFAPSATPMRTSTRIVASSSIIELKTVAMPTHQNRLSSPPPLFTGTAVNHDDIPCGLRKTRRKPTRYLD